MNKMQGGYRRYLAFILFLLRSLHSFSLTTTTTKPSVLQTNLIQLRPDSANDILCSFLENEDDTRVILQGLVTKRRAIGKHLVFLDVIPMETPHIQAVSKDTLYDDIGSVTPVQAILRRDFWKMSNLDDDLSNMTSSYDVYHKIIQPAIHATLIGHAGPSRNANEAILFIHSAKYNLANDNPQHLRSVLRFAKQEELDINEVCNALPCIGNEEVVEMIGSLGSDTTKAEEMAAKILSQFPKNYLCNPSKLTGSTNSQKVKLLPPPPIEYKQIPLLNTKRGQKEVASISSVLQQQQNQVIDEKQYKQYTISGWVQNRRRYEGTISVLELVDDFTSLAAVKNDVDREGSNYSEMKTQNSKVKDLWKQRIYAILHPDVLGNQDDNITSIELSETYGNIFCSGARVMVQGYLTSPAAGAPLFWVTSCRLLRSSWRPSAVRHILELLHEGKFSFEEAAGSLELEGGYSQAEEIAKRTTSTERQWMAAEITNKLQGENSRVGKVTKSEQESLRSFFYARGAYPVEKVLGSTSPSSAPLRTSPEGSRFQRAKKPQLKFMIDQIETVLKSHPDYGKRKLKIVDIGGGKGLLSTFLAETFGNDTVDVQVIEISKSATNNGMMRARRSGIENVMFDNRDATTIDFTSGVDVVVALHACGVLSDVALGHAVCQGAGFVICPCCFKSNPHLQVSMPSSADANNPSKLVSVDQWLDVDLAQYENLKHLAELQGDISLASKAMHAICGLRAMAVNRQWRSKRPGELLDISIKSYPIGFSTRNLCLVGRFSKK